MSEHLIYLDYNATTPIDPAVAAAMQPYLTGGFGNPSSTHRFGIEARKAVEGARARVARLIGARVEEVVFTSGGTESNNLAIQGVAFGARDRGSHIVTSAVEHPAVSEVCDYLAGHGLRITRVPVDETGRVHPDDVARVITADTVLISIMHANNEVGTIQPVSEIAALARARGITLHTDAAQSLGKIPVDVDELGVGLLSIAGHKLYAPKGVGALYVRTGTRLAKFLHGADHEGNRRPGTENVMEIVGLGKACELATEQLADRSEHMRNLRDRLHEGLRARIPELRLNGPGEGRLPNTLSVCLPGVEADAVLSELTGVAASAGAACHADEVTMSATLEAMGVPEEWARGAIRLSTGSMLSEAEVDSAVEQIADVVERLAGSGSSGPAIGATGEPIRLTRYTTGLGCACKLRPQALERVLAALPKRKDPRVLVGHDSADDAAVYRISDEVALVQTVDFFTPVVDEPYWFGAIAAANSLSDVYAMGGIPSFALSIVGFPTGRLPLEALQEILRGAVEVADQAGISIIGGHTIETPEPIFGLAVTGTVSPERIRTNDGAKPGDALVLTKPLGTGILTTALKRGLLDPPQVDRLHRLMSTLNAEPAEIMADYPVDACTDVTGFGLLGHLKELVTAAGVAVRLDHRSLPLIEDAVGLAAAGVIPGGTENNRTWVRDVVSYSQEVPETVRILAADAQTSGGLLVSLPAAAAADYVGALHTAGVQDAVVIGRVEEASEPGVWLA